VPGDPVEQKDSITWLGYFIQCKKNSPIGKRQPKGRKKYGNRRRHCEGLRQRRGKPVGSGAEQTARMGSRVAEQAVEMTTNPWTDGVLPAKLIELVLVGLNASRTNLNPEGTRRHIRAAIAAGATRQEILFVLKCASVMSIPSGSFNAPLLLQEAIVGSLKDFVAQAQETYGKAGKATPAWKKRRHLGTGMKIGTPSLPRSWVDRSVHGHVRRALRGKRSSSKGTGTSASRIRCRLPTYMAQARDVVSRTRSGPVPRWKKLWKF